MDGDICRLPDLVALKKEFGCYLMMDESHATGVLGTHGRGADEHFGVDHHRRRYLDRLAGQGHPLEWRFRGRLAGSRDLPPACRGAIHLLRRALSLRCGRRASDAGDSRERARTCGALEGRNADFLREGLRELGYCVGASQTPIIPVIREDEKSAVVLAGKLRDRGIFVTPVVFPAVPQGSARLRLCVTASHTCDDLEQCARRLPPAALTDSTRIVAAHDFFDCRIRQSPFQPDGGALGTRTGRIS